MSMQENKKLSKDKVTLLSHMNVDIEYIQKLYSAVIINKPVNPTAQDNEHKELFSNACDELAESLRTVQGYLASV